MNIDDIRQGRHGDCFILASLISILNTLGKDYIDNLIKSNKDVHTFSYYSDKLELCSCNFYYIADKLLSPKSADWVKKIEYIYIKLFHKDTNEIIQNGGCVYNVFLHLLGKKPKVFLNKFFDNKENFFYDFCKNTINNETWTIDSFNSINKLFRNKIYLWIDKIWNNLLKNTTQKENKFILLEPAVIGTNSIYTKIEIPGLSLDHCYSVCNLFIDNNGYKYITVCNPHYNAECRQTFYDEKENKFITKISISRYGIWSMYEIILFSSEITI